MDSGGNDENYYHIPHTLLNIVRTAWVSLLLEGLIGKHYLDIFLDCTEKLKKSGKYITQDPHTLILLRFLMIIRSNVKYRKKISHEGNIAGGEEIAREEKFVGNP